MKVACILSEVDDTTIPVENFIALDHCVNKTVVVYGKVCAESVVSKINKSGADFFYFESFFLGETTIFIANTNHR